MFEFYTLALFFFWTQSGFILLVLLMKAHALIKHILLFYTGKNKTDALNS